MEYDFDFDIFDDKETPKIKNVVKKIVFKDIIIFENEDYILINKPPYLSSLDERTQDKHQSILRLAKEYSHDAQLCHRLDKETSGVLAIAKNPAAYRNLAMQFEAREVTKRYHAVVNGVHSFDGVSVYLPIAQLRDGTGVRIDREKGKIAETIFYTLKAYRHYSLVECLPITGRMHQIRVHLQCLKAPIVSDPMYGGNDIFLSQIKSKNFNLKNGTEEIPLIRRVALHAHSLTFRLLNEEVIKIEAPYPKDFSVVVKQLDKFG
ncbi:Ribosomal large subunit pseudouridine synthase C [Emticicia aquatica]|uniref:Ribosomal large subunit pseudouridine synthase C n=1 Tax=Emticicia aquatica TaxID=1681835 RepID=A0ABM9AS94_9BACT|nr:RluA family pseudouridine synthase [Emticicia aquatica]CAH0996399.1 Ribosomal large subunit pseudouridine synthase C [Emticicia aquatica]